jgi:hypothetical protein
MTTRTRPLAFRSWAFSPCGRNDRGAGRCLAGAAAPAGTASANAPALAPMKVRRRPGILGRLVFVVAVLDTLLIAVSTTSVVW